VESAAFINGAPKGDRSINRGRDRDMKEKLATDLQIACPDDFYEALIEAHRNLLDADSRHFNARLILILANQVGDMEILTEALNLARADLISGE
jgi:hypothetical protein